MAAIKGTLALLLIDEFDFSGDTAGFGVAINMTEEECTALGAAAAEYEPILPSMAIEHNGYVSGVIDAGEFEAELYSRLGVAGSFVAALLGTDVAACPAYVQNTFGANMQMQAPAKSLMTLNGAWGKGRGGSRGIRVFSGAISGTGNAAAVDLGSAGSNGGKAYLFLQSITGSASNAAFKVQSATTEGGSYSDEGTFTVSAVGGYEVDLSGTVNRWVRLSTSSMGGATGFTAVLVVCVDSVTQ